MRHTIFWLSFLCVLLVATLAVSSAAPEPVGKIDVLSGTASVEREGRKVPGKVGEPVHLLDKWQTGAGSSLEILFVDNSRVKLAADTTLEITEYLYNPDQKTRQTLLSMATGKARFLVQEMRDFKEKRFRVQTQTSVVGTRDTDFIVRVKSGTEMDELCKEGLTEALCVENAIRLANRDTPENEVVLTANMISRICGLTPPTPPRFATAEERSRLLTGLDVIGPKTGGLQGKAGGGKQQTVAAPPLPPEYPSSDIAIPVTTGIAAPTLPPTTLPGTGNNTGPTLNLPPTNTRVAPPKVQPPLPPPPPPPGG